MQFVRFFLVWGQRLPVRLTLPFAASMLIYLVLISQVVQSGEGTTTIADFFWKGLVLLGVPSFLGNFAIVKVFWEGIVVVLILLVGGLLSYNLSVWIYRRLRPAPTAVVQAPTPATPGADTRLQRYEKIGIILAGGGAKGAYQAGAMKAIHEFLERNNALDKVQMIAGTSIGSWNAMFWLAGLVKPPSPTERSVHEEWWRSISVSRLVEFDTYWPFRRNHFVLSTPWQEAFQQIFIETPEVRDHLARLFVSPTSASGGAPLHFYFTRSNVVRGHLEFATNWTGMRILNRPNPRTEDPNDTQPLVGLDRYEVIDGGNIVEALMRTQQAVFASMDLPPLFPYMQIKTDVDEWFEDGGVVNNLPVWFGTQIEQCDLLFILPLNASFAEPINHTSVSKRLFRVMDVRQGVLERNALKLTYLYNELAANQQAAASAASSVPVQVPIRPRQHKQISVFAICPDQPLGIGTTEFWKPLEAGQAFELMYAETKYELEEKFEEATNPHWLRMALVSPNGGRIYVDDF